MTKWVERIRHLWLRTEFRVTLISGILILIFGLKAPQFFAGGIWKGIFRMASDIGFLALGETIVLTAREIDLSAASVYAWSAYIVLTLANAGINPVLAVIAALLVAVLIGFVNGVIRVRTRVHSLLVTLASMWIQRGILFIIFTEKYSYFNVEKTILIDVWRSYINIIPSVFLWFIGFTVIFTILLARTKFGNHVLAVGGNPTVARNLGVQVERTKILCFMLCSLMAALAGAVYIVQNILIYPDSGMNIQYGSGLELEAICISVMGGTSIFGGSARYPAVFIAAIAYSMFRSGLILFGLPGYWYIPFTGLLILIFVLLHRIGAR